MAGGINPINYKDEKLFFLDQTKLPEMEEWREIVTVEDCWDAIKRLVVRGAPAIGIGAAFGMHIASRSFEGTDYDKYKEHMEKARAYLAESRPTAVNLFWALDRMMALIDNNAGRDISDVKKLVLDEAIKIQKEDEDICKRIGEYGQEIVHDGISVLTHCNAGALATSKYGTALAPIYIAHERGLHIKVFADETRPLLQGARLTAYELHKSGIDVTLITDNMAAAIMKKGWVDVCIVGCDRLAANGDAANKIGTYGVAVLAKAHGIPFYVACPISTIDLNTDSGEGIIIEERSSEEIIFGMGKQTAPMDIKTYNPAFDVTPNELISGIITENGIIRPPYAENIPKLLNR